MIQAVLGVAAAGAFLVPAAPAAHHPWGLSIAPAHVIAAAGQRSLSYTTHVANTGSEPLAITTTAVFEKACAVDGGAGKWLKASPSSFRLAPGGSRTVHVTVTAPRSAAGSDTLLAVFNGLSAPTAGNGHIAGAVATSIQLTLSGHQAAATGGCKPAQAPKAAPLPPAGGGPGVPLLAGLGIALAAVLLTVWAVALRRRRRPS